MLRGLGAATVLAAIAASAQARCPTGAVQGAAADDCYTFIPAASDWYNAEETCVKRGGHLASVSSAFESAFLRQQAKERAWSDDYWIGGSHTGADWSWTDGTPFKYCEWAKGQPATGDSMCIAPKTLPGQWYGASCSSPKPFVCKLPASAAEHCPQTTTPPQPLCDDEWGYSNVTRKCYKVVSAEERTADQLCVELGGEVISIHSELENTVALEMALADPTEGGAPVDALGMTMGLFCTTDTWEWLDGSPLDYTNWSPKGEFLDCFGRKDCFGLFQLRLPRDGVIGQWVGVKAEWRYPTMCVKAPNIAK